MRLRPYQLEAVERTKEALARSRSACLNLPCGAGKTVIAGEIVRRLSDRGKSALFIVHRRELVRQAQRTFSEFGVGRLVGIIASGRSMAPSQPLQIASVQTLHRRLEKLPWLQPHIVIWDEAHHCRSRTWTEVMQRFEGAYRIGLTATPVRTDGKGLGVFFNELVSGPSHKVLMEQGALCAAETWEIPVGTDIKGLRKSNGDFTRASLARLENGKASAEAISQLRKHCIGKSVLVFARSRAHSRLLVERAQDAGFSAEHVDGATPEGERASILQRFADGETQVLSNVEIVTEGFDCPSCDVVMLARPTASIALLIQMIGRALRAKEGKIASVIDLEGNCRRLSVYPGMDLEWDLEEGCSKERKVSPNRTCAACTFSYPRHLPNCPRCGRTPGREERLPDEIEVDLQRAKDSEIMAVQRARHEKRRMRNKLIGETGGDFAKLVVLGEHFGYAKPAGWAGQIMRTHAWRLRWDQLKREKGAEA